jgi:hypothetical protein
MLEFISGIIKRNFSAPRSWLYWGDSVPRLFEWGISGYVLAALYTGRYDLSNVPGELELNPNSWVAKYSNNLKKSWSTNSSKACLWLLKRI